MTENSGEINQAEIKAPANLINSDNKTTSPNPEAIRVTTAQLSKEDKRKLAALRTQIGVEILKDMKKNAPPKKTRRHVRKNKHPYVNDGPIFESPVKRLKGAFSAMTARLQPRPAT